MPLKRKWVDAATSISEKPEATKVLSPCISVCKMDVLDEICVGCYRTKAEIAEWGSMNQDDQILLLHILRDRRARATGVLRKASRRKKNV